MPKTFSSPFNSIKSKSGTMIPFITQALALPLAREIWRRRLSTPETNLNGDLQGAFSELRSVERKASTKRFASSASLIAKFAVMLDVAIQPSFRPFASHYIKFSYAFAYAAPFASDIMSYFSSASASSSSAAADPSMQLSQS